jgi:hypothetical protein
VLSRERRSAIGRKFPWDKKVSNIFWPVVRSNKSIDV